MITDIDSLWPEPPAARAGLAGEWDRFIGPGATRAEFWLIISSAVLGAAALALYVVAQNLGWSAVQLGVAVLLALDLVGGVVTNATTAAKRWYHRPGQGFRQHFRFVAFHLHPFLVAWLFRDGDWVFGFVIYGFLLLATLLILRTRLYLQRPLAMALVLIGLILGLTVFPPTPGMAWFVPVFYLKLLVSHLLKEWPYSPEAVA
ncbi:MAG: hypothetical protein R2844_20590 [Caldilineales bacterium]